MMGNDKRMVAAYFELGDGQPLNCMQDWDAQQDSLEIGRNTPGMFQYTWNLLAILSIS